MADANTVPRKRRGWLRKLAWIAGVFVVLLIVLYFVATSSAFLTGVILPRVGKSMNAKITVADASIHPFSGVDLHQLKVETIGSQPLVTANEVRVAYHLLDILRGNYRVDEITLESPTIQIVKNADGTSNLDPLTKSSKAEPSKPASTTSKTSSPMKLDVKKIAFNNVTIRTVETKSTGEQDTTDLSNVHLELDDIKNGQAGKLTLSADLKMDNRVPAPGTNSLLQAKVGGAFSLTPTADMKSAAVNGSAHFTVDKAAGALGAVAGLNVNLDSDITPTEIKQVALSFQKTGENLGVIRASGPLDLAKNEGRVTLAVSGIDHRLLELFGAQSGMDFGSTTISSTNQIVLASGGSSVAASGQLILANLVMRTANGVTPALDFKTAYDVNLNHADNSTLLRALTFDCTQNHQPFLHGELSKPMTLSQSGSANAVGDATFKLSLTKLNLADWKAVVSTPLSNDVINVTANVGSQQGGQQLAVDFNTTVDDPNGQRVLGAGASAQYSLKSHQADIRQVHLDLPPTARATNQVTLSGQIDMSQPGALQGNLKLLADSLDFTALYDQFSGKPAPKTSGQAPARPAPWPAPAPAAANAEPAAMHLPVRSLVMDAKIGRLYLREVAVTNWQTTVKIDDTHVAINPCQLAINGAPVNATVALNLGVPGYQYDVSFSADKVPIAPLADSFSEAEAGKAKGDLIAHAQIKGAGITGTSLKKSLTGAIDFAFTNANIELAAPKVKTVVTYLAEGLRLPELTTAPIEWLVADVKMGDGTIQISQFKAVTTALTASTQGTITLADVLTNSPINNLPLNFGLPVSLAKKARLAPPDLATNATDVDLGALYHVGGTIGDYKLEYDKVAIAMLTAKALPIGGDASKFINQLAGTNSTGAGAKDLLKNVGSILGKKSGDTNSSATNKPAKAGLFDQLLK